MTQDDPNSRGAGKSDGAGSDEHLGAVETDKPGQAGQGNPNVPALDPEGRPADWTKICEDVIGANVDESEGG